MSCVLAYIERLEWLQFVAFWEKRKSSERTVYDSLAYIEAFDAMHSYETPLPSDSFGGQAIARVGEIELWCSFENKWFHNSLGLCDQR